MRWALWVVALAVLVGACSSGDDASAPTTTAAPTTTVDPTAEITAAFETFFSPALPDEERLALLENGDAMRSIYDAAKTDPSTGPLIEQLGARIDKIAITSASTAEVDFAILIDGKPVTEGVFFGQAVVVDGTWRVANATLCSLLALSDPAVNQEPACAVAAG